MRSPGELEKKVDQPQELSEKTDLASFADDTSNKRFFDFKAELVNLTKVLRVRVRVPGMTLPCLDMCSKRASSRYSCLRSSW